MTAPARPYHPKFGDRMRGIYASEGNPIRDGIFVETVRRTGRMNAGTFYRLTDGRGRFWEYPSDSVVPLDMDDTAKPVPCPMGHEPKMVDLPGRPWMGVVCNVCPFPVTLSVYAPRAVALAAWAGAVEAVRKSMEAAPGRREVGQHQSMPDLPRGLEPFARGRQMVSGA
jgi:hypothetical protein